MVLRGLEEAFLEEVVPGLVWNEEQEPAGSRALTGLSPLQEQRSAVFVILFALITILILYSSNSANDVFHYGSQLGRTRRPVNLKKWSITDGYVPLLGNKVGQLLWGASWGLPGDPPPPSSTIATPTSSSSTSFFFFLF